MPDLRARLEHVLGANYTIERELGGGGMARVFVAAEIALGRQVVIKVLSPETAASVSHQRFAREIRLAASLQQANIVPVLSTGEMDAAAGDEDALPYYVMPLVDGLSLHDKLSREGALAVPQAIGVLRDVARALAYAHERGVVHRDIKPGNVLLSGESAVVTDFGIAKALAAAQGGNRAERAADVSGTALTGLGTAIGTPAYMSPEQVTGDPDVDHRADLYSFGCLAYEVFTGSSPFAGRSAHHMLAAHVTERPVPLGERCPACPAPVVNIVMRCLEKQPTDRPQSARAILSALDGGTAPATVLTRLWNRQSRRQRIAAVASAVLVIAVVSAAQFRAWRSARDAVSSIAVVPFFNVGGDSAEEYLADGMADELATALGKIPGIRIVARTAGRQYKGKRDVDARTIGAALGASHVLQGSLRHSGGRLHVLAHLTSARDNDEVWSDTYDRAASDALPVQDEITRAIVNALRGRVLGGEDPVTANAGSGTSNRDAHDLYMRGRFLLQRRARGVRQAAELFEQAIAKDTNYARAHASRALALELLPYFEPVNADSVGALAVRAANTALAMDSALAEAHTALGLAYQHKYQWGRADSAYRRALTVGPDEPDANIQYGRFLFYTGRMSEALPRFERARELDPNSAVASAWVGHLRDLRGEDSAAQGELRRALQIDSTNPPSLLMMAESHLYAGRRDEARVYAERLWRVWPNWRAPAASLLAALGDRESALAVARQLEANGSTLATPSLYATLGDSNRLFDALERATAARMIWPTYMSLSERPFDFVRGSARFAAIVRSVGLDERIFVSPTGGRR